MPEAAKIIYTKTDEAPALATHSLLPILQAFTKGSGFELETWDISLTGRIIGQFPRQIDRRAKGLRLPDHVWRFVQGAGGQPCKGCPISAPQSPS